MSAATLPRTRDRQQLMAWVNNQKKAPLSVAQVAALDSIYPAWRKTLNGTWFSNLEEVEAFLADSRRFPRAGCKEPAEKRIGIWLAAQRYRSAVLTPDRKKLLDDRLPGWNKSADEAWNERFEEVRALIEKLGRLPHTTSKDAKERKGAAWLHRHLRFPESDPRVQTLNERIPGWNAMTLDNKWTMKLDALVAFIAEYGRMPTQHEKSREHKLLGSWLNGQRQAADMPIRRREQLDKRAAGWDRTANEKWQDSFDFVVEYFARNGSLPNERSEDKQTAFAGRWVGTQRTILAKLPPQRLAALDAELPGWRTTKEDRWSNMLDYVVAFEETHGTLPNSNSEDAREARAGTWLQVQKQGKNLTTERRASLDARLPRWNETQEDIWRRRLRDTEAFCKEHGRRPRQDATSAKEKFLAHWYRNNAAEKLSPAREKLWLAADLGDRRTKAQVWDDTLSEVARFRSTHGRFPTAAGGESGERPIAAWLTYQRGKKSTMDPVRRKALDGSLPGWDTSLDDVWDSKLKQCVSFFQENGRLPVLAKHVGAAEQKLGQWLIDQRKPKRTKRPDRVRKLDEQLPGWLTGAVNGQSECVDLAA